MLHWLLLQRTILFDTVQNVLLDCMTLYEKTLHHAILYHIISCCIVLIVLDAIFLVQRHLHLSVVSCHISMLHTEFCYSSDGNSMLPDADSICDENTCRIYIGAYRGEGVSTYV